MEALVTKYVFYSAICWIAFICFELFSDLLSYTQGSVSIIVVQFFEVRESSGVYMNTGPCKHLCGEQGYGE